MRFREIAILALFLPQFLLLPTLGSAQEAPAAAPVEAPAVIAEVRFHFHDVGAEIAEQRGSVGRRQHRRDVEDTHPFERSQRIAF